jgi:hypothetical protein
MNKGKTAIIQIGNSDDKLSQKEWGRFVARTEGVVLNYAEQIHFYASSDGGKPWQNAAWIFTHNGNPGLSCELSTVAKDFNQDSIALTVGDTEMVGPVKK